LIEVDALTKRFASRVAVDNLSLTVQQGEIYGFLGANGAGKTTTIRMLLGILQPDAGSIRICGRPVRRGDRDGRRLVGAVGEVQHLYGDMTCRAYLRFFARLYGVAEGSRRVETMLDTVGLADRGEDRATDLSKGQQQKLGLARALLHDPPVLLLDEPVSGLDPHGVREVREIIGRERDKGRLVFFSSHALSEVAVVADRIGIMLSGRLVYEDTVAETLKRHGTLEEAFVASTRPVRLIAGLAS
jgi:ABC-2 type transport system ATP-binding protein